MVSTCLYTCPDGVLVELSDLAREEDFRVPLAVTVAVSPDRDTVCFKVLFVLTPGCPPEPVELKAICGPGDDGAPVLTVLLPTED